MDPGAARDRVKRISGCRCIRAHALVTLFKYLFCPPDYISTIGFPRSILIYGSRLRFSECFSSSIFFHLTFSKFPPSLPPSKVGHVSRKTCSNESPFSYYSANKALWMRETTKPQYFRIYDDQIIHREIKLLEAYSSVEAIFIWDVVSIFWKIIYKTESACFENIFKETFD